MRGFKMEVLVMSSDFRSLDVMDVFDSLIWTERYSKCGDFEICVSVNEYALSILKSDFYLWMQGSDSVMIIEGRAINTDTEAGNTFTVTGRCLKSLLERRIIWGQTVLSGNFQNGIYQLLNENIINPVITSRKIPNFIFEASTDPIVTALTIEAQFNGENLYDSVQKLCESANIGFNVTLTENNEFKFKLYAGIDRSYSQITNPYVVFSPKFDNIINSNYAESKQPLKTATLVAGEGEGSARKLLSVELVAGGGSGIQRREMFTDASGVSSTVDGGTLTDEEYYAQLAQKGLESLAENGAVTSFDGEIEPSRMFKYGEDFLMGDILQMANEYGIEAKVRVIELILSQKSEGESVYPTFAIAQ
jgi:hypothetical protein